MEYRKHEKMISFVMVLLLVTSCSMPTSGIRRPLDSQIMSESARMIESCYEMVRGQILEYEEIGEFDLQGTLSGEELVRGTLGEKNGEDYLRFLYMADKFSDTDEVYEAARGLIPDEKIEEIRDTASGIEKSLLAAASSKALSATQKTEFYKDLRALVVKSVVLLTAALVYAFLPDYMIFGKVTAASGVAIAAGVLSSTILAIVEWKDSGVLSTNSDNFEAWLTEVTKEPAAAWAIAAGMITTGKAVSANPVTTALSIAVFAIYGVTDDLKEMLKSYNFSIPV